MATVPVGDVWVVVLGEYDGAAVLGVCSSQDQVEQRFPANVPPITDEMPAKRRLAEWKWDEEGYGTNGLDYELALTAQRFTMDAS